MARYGAGQGPRMTATHLWRPEARLTACDRPWRGQMVCTERAERVTCARCLKALEKRKEAA